MSRTYTGKVFVLFLLVNLLTHLPFLAYPPCGSHVWRQCNTLAMSRNFAEESMNILKPRIDRRNETDGITGSHFPLYEWGLAATFRVFGFSETLARIYSMLISSSAMLAIYLLLSFTGSTRRFATIGGLLLLSVPQVYYDSINAMPDILALPAALFSLYFCLRNFSHSRMSDGIAGALLAIICGLIKFQFLIIPFSAIAFMPRHKNAFRYVFVAASATLLSVFVWYRYALHLTERSNLREYGLWIKTVDVRTGLNTISGNLTSDFPELLSGWPLFAVLCFVLFKSYRTVQTGRIGRMLLIWSGGFFLFYAVAIERMQQHSYYFMALIPVFILLSVRLLEIRKTAYVWMLLLCVLNFTWSFVRIIPSRWRAGHEGIPAEFINPGQRLALSSAVPAGALCLIGPDLSGCIYFYFTHSKGFSFAEPGDLLQELSRNQSRLLQSKKSGIRYLMVKTDAQTAEQLNRIQNKRLIKQVGTFEVWELMSSASVTQP